MIDTVVIEMRRLFCEFVVVQGVIQLCFVSDRLFTAQDVEIVERSKAK